MNAPVAAEREEERRTRQCRSENGEPLQRLVEIRSLRHSLKMTTRSAGGIAAWDWTVGSLSRQRAHSLIWLNRGRQSWTLAGQFSLHVMALLRCEKQAAPR